MENRTGVPRIVIASFIQQEMEVNRQKNEEARAVLMSMFEALMNHAPPEFKTVEELQAWIEQPTAS